MDREYLKRFKATLSLTVPCSQSKLQLLLLRSGGVHTSPDGLQAFLLLFLLCDPRDTTGWDFKELPAVLNLLVCLWVATRERRSMVY